MPSNTNREQFAGSGRGGAAGSWLPNSPLSLLLKQVASTVWCCHLNSDSLRLFLFVATLFRSVVFWFTVFFHVRKYQATRRCFSLWSFHVAQNQKTKCEDLCILSVISTGNLLAEAGYSSLFCSTTKHSFDPLGTHKRQHLCRLAKVPIKRFPADPVASASSSTNTWQDCGFNQRSGHFKKQQQQKNNTKQLEKLLCTCQLSKSEESFLKQLFSMTTDGS